MFWILGKMSFNLTFSDIFVFYHPYNFRRHISHLEKMRFQKIVFKVELDTYHPISRLIHQITDILSTEPPSAKSAQKRARCTSNHRITPHQISSLPAITCGSSQSQGRHKNDSHTTDSRQQQQQQVNNVISRGSSTPAFRRTAGVRVRAAVGPRPFPSDPGVARNRMGSCRDRALKSRARSF